ncbi:NUDIX domain-containing protein [Rhizobium leguminosarum bv. viciae]|uniref:NUDIX domain-containing protein n=1 Tax=Rhizobium leguminosarum TaxID=384 RepID=UPI0014410491|nr:NUDIX domain-containing protein [Rhizobium leguminosarum]NKL08374.1 NUDIX domain-containing protein [Rhizobium leguminosarum bv. viciae]
MSTIYKTAADRITEALKGADELDNWHKHGEGYNDLRRDMTKLRDDLAASYDNPGTVVVPLVEVNGGLLLVRRKLADGYGKLALPGGYQAIGETWEEAGVREVYEETGVSVNPEDLIIRDVVTVQDGKINLIFCQAMFKIESDLVAQDDEVLEVVIAKRAPDPKEIAFPTHAEHIQSWFELLFPPDTQD